MRILILTQYFEPEMGAPQVRLAAVARELERGGHAVEIVTAMPNHPTGRIFPHYRGRFYMREPWGQRSTLHRVWVYSALGAGLKRLLNYGSFTLTSLVGLLRCERPQLILVESPPLFLSVPAWIAGFIWRVPFVFNVADLWPDSVEEMGFLKDGAVLRFSRRLEAWSYARAGLVNAVTDGIRDVLIRKKGIPAEKVTFMPNGVDTSLFFPGEPDPSLAVEIGLQGRHLILYAGTVGLAQGLDVALEAMKRVYLQRQDVILMFMGDGSDRQRLEARVRDEGIQGIRFLEACPVSEVARMYRLATAGFASLRNLPIFEGARPSKVFPIMASAKPVLYSGAGEGARLITVAGAGFVVMPEDPDALAKAILNLLSDPEGADAMGKSGRNYVESHLSWSALVQSWLQQVDQSGVLNYERD